MPRLSCPGRGAALLQRCTAEPGPITPAPDSWVPGLQRIIPQTLHAAQRTGHDIAYFRILAARFARAFTNSLSLSWREGAGNAGCTLHPRSRVPRIAQLAHTSIQVSGNTPTSPAQRLYGLYRALPGGAGLLSPSSLRSVLPKNLAPASRRQDHTTSPYAADPTSPKGFAGLPPFAYGVLRPSHPAPN